MCTRYAIAGVGSLCLLFIFVVVLVSCICVKGIDELVETTEENEPGTFHGDFHMEFCDNKKQLFQAYFRDFTIERLEAPWQAFTGGWYVKIAIVGMGVRTSNAAHRHLKR